jgi:hypothetical protein
MRIIVVSRLNIETSRIHINELLLRFLSEVKNDDDDVIERRKKRKEK